MRLGGDFAPKKINDPGLIFGTKEYVHNLGGKGVWWIAVSISNGNVMLFSNNDIILQLCIYAVMQLHYFAHMCLVHKCSAIL